MRMRMETFDQCLARLMKKHGLNYSELTVMLNYKSKNTLHRIFTGESGDKSRSKVFNDIAGNDRIKFSKEDIEELEQALEVSRIGFEKFEAMAEMRNLLRKKDESADEVYLTDIQTMKKTTLGEFTESLKDFENEIIIINCCWESVSEAMTELMTASPQTKVLHYMVITDNTADTVRKIGNVLPMIYNNGYMGYSAREKVNGSAVPDEFAYNLIQIRAKEHNGKRHAYQMILHNETSGYITQEDFNLLEYWDRITKRNIDNFHPIKSSYSQITTADAYLKFTEMYYKMEQNNTIYTYRPDICFNYIDVPMTKAALLDGLKTFDAGDLAAERMIKRLEDIHTRRFNNIFTKKKVTQHVCTAKGLEKFARTGILSDHFFAMRPYTVKERIEIFKNLLYHEENNPHFNIHLLKDDASFVEMEAICFEDIGVDFTSMQTKYKLTEGHTEAIVRQEDFLELYTEYFTGELLKKHVKPRSETAILLKQLISDMEKAI